MVSLDDKYLAGSGTVLLSGIEALVRVALDQRRLDRERGHDTAAFVSGYPGSPLGGLDRELQRAARHLDPLGILQMAARLDGRHAAGLDQTGLAQKGGPVVSDLRIGAEPIEGVLRAGTAAADVLIGFDPLGAAAADTLAVADPDRTIAVLNTAASPTAAMVTDPAAGLPPVRRAIDRVSQVTRAAEMLAVDVDALSERLFADHLPANMIMVGAAYQHGCLPISAKAIEDAIGLNRAAVERNLEAFRWGRALVADADAVHAAIATTAPVAPELDPRTRGIVDRAAVDGELRRLLMTRVSELIRFQDIGYARAYADAVVAVARIEHERTAGTSTAVVEGYARGLFKLMAYKDEYEVARLHLLEVERERIRSSFGRDAKVQLLLHPPVLRAMGLERKLRVGRAGFLALRLLVVARRLRGTRLDPFGRAAVRRTERALIGEYRDLVAEALERLDPANASRVAEIAALPDLIRGYEQIKLRSIVEFRDTAQKLLGQLSVAE
jgi:indolepyruvate ferredoxin oxidoreductase